MINESCILVKQADFFWLINGNPRCGLPQMWSGIQSGKRDVRSGVSGSCKIEWLSHNKEQEGFTLVKVVGCRPIKWCQEMRVECVVKEVWYKFLKWKFNQDTNWVCLIKSNGKRDRSTFICVRSSKIIVPEWWQKRYLSRDTAGGAKGILL
jgi:hypothetical protein